MTPDRLHAIMLIARASWEYDRYRPYDIDELGMLEEQVSDAVALPLSLRRALACRTPMDLEWTVLLVPALAAFVDAGTAGFGGTWPVQAATVAVAARVIDLEAHADDWATGAKVGPRTLLDLLASTRVPGQASEPEGRR